MFKKPVAINRSQHARLRFTPADNYSFAAQLTHAPVLFSEALELANTYPIVFDIESGMPLALLGLTENENLYIDESGTWYAKSIPASCQQYPFALHQLDGPDADYCLVMDEAADTLQDKTGKLLFNKSGDSFRTSPFLKQVESQLVLIEQHTQLTKSICSKLIDSGVLKRTTLKFKLLDDTEHTLTGFAAIDWNKVDALSEDTLGEWQNSGLMAVMKAHKKSMKLIGNLVAAAKRRAEAKNTQVH